jgi:hypothetical protein
MKRLLGALAFLTLVAAETFAQTAPSFVTQPGNQSVNDGSSVTLNVTVNTSLTTTRETIGGISFDLPTPAGVSWQLQLPTRTISPSGIATASVNTRITASLSFGPISMADAGTFRLIATNIFGATQSETRTIAVAASPPTITTQPGNQTVLQGGSASFSVSASGTGPFTYQWRKDGAAIAGANGATLTLTNTQSAAAGAYSVVVSNAVGSAVSSNATLSVTPPSPPSAIAIQPINQTVALGGTATFSASANGTAPLSYQWRKDGAAIVGATASTLAVAAIPVSAAGTYSVVVSNAFGSATSGNVTLVVVAPPVIATQPTSQSTGLGGTAAFSVTATGIGPISYQWSKNGSAIPGATNVSITITNASAADAGNYTVTASNAGGSISSNQTSLTVRPPLARGRLANMSIRTGAGTGDATLIVGVGIGGAGASGNKAVLLRGAGPTLGVFGVGDALADTVMTVFQGTTQIAQNDDWDASSGNTFAGLGAFAFGAGSRDSAIYNGGLASGSYSIQVGGKAGATGIALAEIYDATPSASFTAATPRLVNVSARTQVGTGDNILIAGFVIGGSTPVRVLIRAVGPTLGVFGVGGALADPKLEVYNSTAAKIGENDNWAGTAELKAAFSSVAAFALSPDSSRDAALIATLQPGSYTVQVSGVGGTTGVALVEVYEVP